MDIRVMTRTALASEHHCIYSGPLETINSLLNPLFGVGPLILLLKLFIHDELINYT